ncbi:MAG TPA: HEAT repeat domain-containing protein [Polyangiaceae bacterium]|nr:HEAT repeat domain-containing protein [Polyangiaceae bacterium]
MLRVRGLPKSSLALLLAVAWLFVGRAALAQGTGDVDRMIDNLKNGSDFRVRTQAALALGASHSPRATAALCAGLGDPNVTVRAAAAAGLGKLQLGGTDCLSARLADEPSPIVKSAIQKALEQVKGGALPAIGPSTKFYISIGKTTDKSGRSGDGVDRMVHASMAGAAGDVAVAIAPDGETADAAKKVLAAHKGLRAFYLSPKVGPIEYGTDTLKVRLEIAIFTYPDKSLLGNFAVPLTQQGVSGKDTGSEDDLVKMAAERAMQKFPGIAAQIQ